MAGFCDDMRTARDALAYAQSLTHESSIREKVFEHLLLADLGMELMARGIPLEVLHGEIDRDGYDVVLDAAGIMRHVQLKVTILGGTRGVITVNNRLSAKPSGCVVWLNLWIGVQKGPPWRGDRRPKGTPHFDGLVGGLGILRRRDRDVGGGDGRSYSARVRRG